MISTTASASRRSSSSRGSSPSSCSTDSVPPSYSSGTARRASRAPHGRSSGGFGRVERLCAHHDVWLIPEPACLLEVHDVSTEGGQRDRDELEVRQAERDADDRD